MFFRRRFAKPLTTVLFGGFIAFALSTALVEGRAHAQISGSIGGDLVPADEVANGLAYVLTNTMISSELVQPEGRGRVSISADVTTTDAGGGTHTTRIIAVLIGLFAPRAPGFMDYIDDACMLDDGGAPDEAQLRACTLMGRAFRTVVQGRRVSP